MAQEGTGCDERTPGALQQATHSRGEWAWVWAWTMREPWRDVAQCWRSLHDAGGGATVVTAASAVDRVWTLDNGYGRIHPRAFGALLARRVAGVAASVGCLACSSAGPWSVVACERQTRALVWVAAVAGLEPPTSSGRTNTLPDAIPVQARTVAFACEEVWW